MVTKVYVVPKMPNCGTRIKLKTKLKSPADTKINIRVLYFLTEGKNNVLYSILNAENIEIILSILNMLALFEIKASL